jgi:hypothetical protein
VTYVTVADDKFFLGAVGLVNSLRLSGNEDDVVIIDGGLTDAQRALLATACDVRKPPVSKSGVFVVFLKAAAHLLGLRGTVVLIDSDVIVTRRFSPILDQAAAGKICVVGSEANPTRRFPDEWRKILRLSQAVREQPYMGAGLVVLDIDRWGGFMRRWLELCELVPADRNDLPFELPGEAVPANPFAYNEMDVMNALFMTEVPEDSIVDLGLHVSPGPPDNDAVRIIDRSKMRCLNGSDEPYLLHYWNHPKAWLPDARPHLAFDAYVDLLTRALNAHDAPIHVDAAELPVWLRDDFVGRFVRRAPRRARRTVRGAVSLLPEPVERRARDLGGSVASRIRLG